MKTTKELEEELEKMKQQNLIEDEKKELSNPYEFDAYTDLNPSKLENQKITEQKSKMENANKITLIDLPTSNDNTITNQENENQSSRAEERKKATDNKKKKTRTGKKAKEKISKESILDIKKEEKVPNVEKKESKQTNDGDLKIENNDQTKKEIKYSGTIVSDFMSNPYNIEYDEDIKSTINNEEKENPYIDAMVEETMKQDNTKLEELGSKINIKPTQQENKTNAIQSIEQNNQINKKQANEVEEPTSTFQPLESQNQIDNINSIEPQNQVDDINSTEPQNQIDNINSIEPQNQVDDINSIEPQNQVDDINSIEPQNQVDDINSIEPQNQVDDINSIEPQNQVDITNPIDSQTQINTVQSIKQENLTNLAQGIQNDNESINSNNTEPKYKMCMVCGTMNLSSNSNCENCGATLK